MSTSRKRTFVSFRDLSPDNPLYAATCSARKNDETRCPTQLCDCGGPVSFINDLHERIESDYDWVVNDGRLGATLEALAKLSLCGRHNKDGTIEAAARQWQDEIESANWISDYEAAVPDPGSPLAETGEEDSRLTFRPYRPIEVQKLMEKNLWRELDRKTDEDIHRQIITTTRYGKDPNKYLYIFGHEKAPGMYKIGYSEHLKRVTTEHEKCYPNLDLYYFVKCPNARLFERVVHLEFRQHRYWHRCAVSGTRHKDGRKHTEWFEVPLEDLIRSVEVWSKFSRSFFSGDLSRKQSEVRLGLPGVSSDADRWHNWALRFIQQWSNPNAGLHAETPRPVRPTFVTDSNHYFDAEDEIEPPPELSPPNSGPATPGDEPSDPPTPTPSSRTRPGMYHTPEPLVFSQDSPSGSSDAFWRVTAPVEEDYLTPETFYSLPPNTPTPAARKRSPLFSTLKEPEIIHFAGVSGKADLSQKGYRQLDPLQLAELLQQMIFF
ncbi:hypothetical protein BJY04DRAFT_13483 [Aspergillus karnatakaensis]|uniref:GIY-YIG nuclease family protein n=1 Tax=Aspergillus karnatakaensis TaxID=1810916 RepID=UPI003CCCE46A